MKIFRTAEMPFVDALTRGNFANRRKELGEPGRELGAGVWELPPGKRSFPLHSHHVTEEALFVISGTADVRTLEGETPIGPGDYVAFPPGGPAHQLVNHGTEPMVYLAMSVSQGVDVVEYPDSGKVASSVGAFPTGKHFIFKKGTEVDYFADEPNA